MLSPGHKIDHYTFHECVGEGGMARVYKVWHDGLHRFEALKTPRGSHGNAPDSAYITRLLAEARVAASLHHPNIVGIHNVSTPDAEVPFFTMDWVEGRDLAKFIAERNTFSLDETIEILEPVAQALDYAHKHGVVHRDVKPANILLGEVGGTLVPRVVDFGISRAAEDDEEGATKLTKSGMLVGTPEYMSPEQSGSGAPVDFHTDIYSLGVVAFEMLCGRPPFTALEGVSRLSILISHVRDTAPLWDHVPHFPRHSGEVLLRALSKSPEKRYTSCAAFIEELKAAAAKDGPFTAFVYDENGARTPFDSSRFVPADAATLMEKPGATLTRPETSVPITQPEAGNSSTRNQGSTEGFMSLGARLKSAETSQHQEVPKTRSGKEPAAPIVSKSQLPTVEPVTLQTPASRLGLPASETQNSRKLRPPSAAVLAVLVTCLVGGALAWTLSNRVSDAVRPVTTPSKNGSIKEPVDVEVKTAPDVRPVSTQTRATATAKPRRPVQSPPKAAVVPQSQTTKAVVSPSANTKAATTKLASKQSAVKPTPKPKPTVAPKRAVTQPRRKTADDNDKPRPRVRSRKRVVDSKPTKRVIRQSAPRRPRRRISEPGLPP